MRRDSWLASLDAAVLQYVLSLEELDPTAPLRELIQRPQGAGRVVFREGTGFLLTARGMP